MRQLIILSTSEAASIQIKWIEFFIESKNLFSRTYFVFGWEVLAKNADGDEYGNKNFFGNFTVFSNHQDFCLVLLNKRSSCIFVYATANELWKHWTCKKELIIITPTISLISALKKQVWRKTYFHNKPNFSDVRRI